LSKEAKGELEMKLNGMPFETKRQLQSIQAGIENEMANLERNHALELSKVAGENKALQARLKELEQEKASIAQVVAWGVGVGALVGGVIAASTIFRFCRP
jgi:hypothetical protein